MLANDEFAGRIVAGVDEAGRGPIAGPVVASAVVLPVGFSHPGVVDSKTLGMEDLLEMEEVIKREAVAWSTVAVDVTTIDRANILQATFLAMNRAVVELCEKAVADGVAAPDLLLIDGPRFRPQTMLEYRTVVGGDALYPCISAASILAKTHRDRLMIALSTDYPHYGWEHNMGYPTPEHLSAVITHGITPHHRRTFRGVSEHLDDKLF